MVIFLKNLFKYKKFLWQKRGIHYGFTLLFIHSELKHDLDRVKAIEVYEKENVINTINKLLTEVENLLHILLEEEKTSHVRSTEFKNRYKEFWSTYSTYSLEIYE